MKKETTMSNQLVATPPIHRHSGRKKVRGALEFNKHTGSICWVLGYCNECNGKVTASREEIEQLKLSVSRNKKRIMYRLLMRLLSHYEA